MTFVRISGEPFAHQFCAVDIFLNYHPPSSNITRCQVPSRVGACFHDSADDIDFHQMLLSQLKRVIFNDIILSCKIVASDWLTDI